MQRTGKSAFAALLAALAFALLLAPTPPINAADHGDAPFSSQEREADIADLYAFLDPNDNTKMVIAVTHQGFIVPGEALNFGYYDPTIRFQIDIENTGDARADDTIVVSFGPRTSTSDPQMATITLPNGRTFMAPTTPASLSATAPTPTLTTDAPSGVVFFAGVVGDPFFFDIPGFSRFVASARAGNLDPTTLQRGRDSFAGYNTMGFALSIPLTQLEFNGDVIGFNVNSQVQSKVTIKNGTVRSKGRFETIDRMGNPAVNVVLIPFAHKDEYNFATNADNANNVFTDDILDFLALFGTDDTSIGILAGLAVANGDFLRINRTIANTGSGGGTNAEAAFPNGRRLGDDTVDILLFVIANRTPLSDNANSNDVALRDTFPFFAAAQQPRDPGTIDDNTRN
jgi:hypothetical protein